MKEKLQKDLKFLKPWYGRLIVSGVFASIPSATLFDGEDSMFAQLVFTGFLFIVIYFFYAWLYPNIDKN
ncbi:MAG: hypothetical protein IPF81_07845 [Bacteroidetes bacterium]|nr:hypothetical protein [Bacteroidota bacterium]